MPKAILDKLPDKAKDIYEAAWEQAKKDGHDDETAAKIAISRVKQAGYSKDDETGRWQKMRIIPMHITKAAMGDDGIMRWAATTTKFSPDDQGDEVTPEFYRYAKAQVAAGKRPDPVLCISHIDLGKPDDSWVAGNVTDFYISAGIPKAKGIFRDTSLGQAAFDSVRDDDGKPDDEKVRISLGFYDEDSEPLQTQKADGSEVTGRRYQKGWIKHLALTRVPVVKETEISVMEGKAMAKTKKEDAATIVGAELAEELVREDKGELEEGLVLKTNDEQESETGEQGGEIQEEPTEKPKEEKSVDLDDFRYRVSNAWHAQFRTPQESKEESWVSTVMDDAVIVTEGGKIYRTPYSVDVDTGEIQFGTPIQVQEITQFVPVSEGASSIAGASIPRVATKAEIDTRRDQIIGLLDQLKGLLVAELEIETMTGNAAALGSPGTNPPHAQPAKKGEIEDSIGDQEIDEKAKALATRQPATPEAVEVAAFVDSWAMQVKGALLSEGDRREKFATLQQLINTFGDGIQALVKEGTPPSSRDIADVINDAVRSAVEPVINEMAGVKAELDELKGKAAVLGTAPVLPAPQPTSLDSKAQVISQQQTPVLGGVTQKARTAKELAWLSTQEGPGY